MAGDLFIADIKFGSTRYITLCQEWQSDLNQLC